MLPKHLDEKVARLHLEKIGVKLTEMSKEQADYIGVPKTVLTSQSITVTKYTYQSSADGAAPSSFIQASNNNKKPPIERA